jgi:hypothetical protein
MASVSGVQRKRQQELHRVFRHGTRVGDLSAMRRFRIFMKEMRGETMARERVAHDKALDEFVAARLVQMGTITLNDISNYMLIREGCDGPTKLNMTILFEPRPEIPVRAGDEVRAEEIAAMRSGEEVPPGYSLSEPQGDLQHAFVFHSLTPGRCGYGEYASLCGAVRAAHSPLAERRQMLTDLIPGPVGGRWGEVVEQALKVRLTPAITESVAEILDEQIGLQDHDLARMLTLAALKAAGFEVTE